jgi:large subunit ribosomal protein L4
MSANLKVYDMKANVVGSIKLSDAVFAVPYNESLIHQVVVAYLANQRQGTKRTLNRGEVRGRAAKPWKQKHTGRARHGSRRSNLWIKGGMAFALRPRDFSQKINKTAKRVAFLSALSAKAEQNDIVVVDNLNLKSNKTKQMAEIFEAFKFDKSVLIVLDEANKNVMLASRNIKNAEVVNYDLLNTYQVVSKNKIMITKEAIKKLEEAYTDGNN